MNQLRTLCEAKCEILFKLLICLSLAAVLFMPLCVYASPFRDVTSNHFAFDAIMFAKDPINGAFLVGDARGNFNPRRQVSKFEASRAFALAAGFRHVLPSLPAKQQELQNRALVMWRPFLESMASEYGRWQRAHDPEIAFLLYKGILTIDDVKSFVTRTSQNESHSLLAMSDANLWAMRLADADEEDFEASLAHDRVITRAELAVLLFDVLYVPSMETYAPFVSWQYPVTQFDFTNEANMETVTISGRVSEIRVDALSSITVQAADGSIISFYVTSDVVDIFDLRVGLLVRANVVGVRAVSISIWGSAL